MITFGITTIEQLEKACQEGNVAELAGFGEKTQTNIARGSNLRPQYADRHLLGDAIDASEPILDNLGAHLDVIRCNTTGSLRRSKEVIGDIDFLVYEGNRNFVSKICAESPEVVLGFHASRKKFTRRASE